MVILYSNTASISLLPIRIPLFFLTKLYFQFFFQEALLPFFTFSKTYYFIPKISLFHIGCTFFSEAFSSQPNGAKGSQIRILIAVLNFLFMNRNVTQNLF